MSSVLPPFCDRYQQMMQTLKNTMIVAVESLINRFEEDQMRKEELHRERQQSQSNSQYIDNCSDSDSSFNQVRDVDEERVYSIDPPSDLWK